MAVLAKSVEGVEISWRDGSRTVPLFTRDEMKRYWPKVVAAALEWKKDEGDAVELPVTVILAALQRRYPEVTREELKSNLTTTLRDLWQELWALSYLNLEADRGPMQ
ncbi:hypothetical protein [Candidatus Binatus sp.]|uniref:hypothetical protein n=1 Tax=Candidatus Binatus sp. TaxID=2811406 RepID=UPI002FDA6F86